MSRQQELRDMATSLDNAIRKSWVMDGEEYQKHNAEIRNKAIDEFAEKMCTELTERSFQAVTGMDLDWQLTVVSHDKMQEVVMEIAEQLKGGAK